jgi:transposase-like protein
MDPTKEQLIQDYFEINLTHQQIAEKYGYKTRQVVSRWFKKYNITTKNKSQLAKEKFANKITLPTKEELKKLYPKYSISQIAKKTVYFKENY